MEINAGLNQVSAPTFPVRESKERGGRDGDGLLLQKSGRLGTSRRSRRKRREIIRGCAAVAEENGRGGEEGEEDDVGKKAEVERKIVALQRIVPGGEALGVDRLFEETADYILALQCQIKAMRLLAAFLQGLEKEKSKFGG
ncbi:hypothetical protein Tsubulata_035509 [Turnera subulata]|uniref:BHLH domain-containing protein n=1 Tax=Turnera subulata TaxID=218843 RepID=A0A9Q0FGM4_9ROSI|nr:hypothetical protein Tsubulata_035509 [Turnera subulata]